MTFRDFTDILRRRWLLVVIPLVVTVASASIVSALWTPVYRGVAEVVIQPRGDDGLFDVGTPLTERSIQTEIRVVEGQEVRARVAEDLGLDGPPPEPDVDVIDDTEVISIAVEDPDPRTAATTANAYAAAFIEVRREQSVQQLTLASEQVLLAIEELQGEIDELAPDDPRRASLLAQQTNFESLLDELRVDAALRTGSATIIEPAAVPDDPVAPEWWLIALLASAIGLLLGVSAAFVVEYFDDRVRGADDVRRATDVPVLAEVPVFTSRGSRPVSLTDSSDPSVEAFRGLRTNIRVLAMDRDLRVILVTSSGAAEGKTTIATNLAVLLARAGHEVALVDADLRRPGIGATFGLQPVAGFTELLLGVEPQRVVCHRSVSEAHSIAIFTAGQVPSHPGEMLSGRRASEVLADLRARYEYVIVDSAPVLPVADSVTLASGADGVVVVVHGQESSGRDVTRCLERLDHVAAPVVGIVLNHVRRPRRTMYYADYGVTVGPPRPVAPIDVAADA